MVTTTNRDCLFIFQISEVKSTLCAKDAECEQLRSQTARQSTLIGSLQQRLQAVEHRERALQVISVLL